MEITPNSEDGLVFGRWTLLETPNDDAHRVLCRCICGAVKIVKFGEVRSGTKNGCRACIFIDEHPSKPDRPKSRPKPRKRKAKKRKTKSTAIKKPEHAEAPYEKIPGERWRPVVGFERTYKVSSKGRVKRISRAPRTRPGLILAGCIGEHGYRMVVLCDNELRRNVPIHVLVAESFIGPRPEEYVVNHMDCNKENNCAVNLEYVTQRENSMHYWRHKRLADRKKRLASGGGN